MTDEFQISGQNAAALFTLKLHRGDGMALIAMNWKNGRPPQDFVGFANFRVAQQEARKVRKQFVLTKPPRHPGEKPWWDEDYTDARKIRDRELFA